MTHSAPKELPEDIEHGLTLLARMIARLHTANEGAPQSDPPLQTIEVEPPDAGDDPESKSTTPIEGDDT